MLFCCVKGWTFGAALAGRRCVWQCWGGANALMSATGASLWGTGPIAPLRAPRPEAASPAVAQQRPGPGTFTPRCTLWDTVGAFIKPSNSLRFAVAAQARHTGRLPSRRPQPQTANHTARWQRWPPSAACIGRHALDSASSTPSQASSPLRPAFRPAGPLCSHTLAAWTRGAKRRGTGKRCAASLSRAASAVGPLRFCRRIPARR